MSHTCPTCGSEMSLDRQRDEGICTNPEEHLEEAKRLANADPVVDWSQRDANEVWNQTYQQNLLHSIAHSLVVIAERIEFGE